jgi:hypothetical protein
VSIFNVNYTGSISSIGSVFPQLTFATYKLLWTGSDGYISTLDLATAGWGFVSNGLTAAPSFAPLVAGVTLHHALGSLDYESAGHIGFAQTTHDHTKSQITDLEVIASIATSSAIVRSNAAGKIDDSWLNNVAAQFGDVTTVLATVGIAALGISTYYPRMDHSHAAATYGTYKLLWADENGSIAQITLGTAGTVVTSNGPTSAPEFVASASGVTVHDLLANLSYASSGHTGFQATLTNPVTTDDTSTTDNEIVRIDGTDGVKTQGTPTTPPTIDDAGIITINNATDATTKDDGCLILQGGLGAEKSIVAGLRITAGLAISLPAWVTGKVYVANSDIVVNGTTVWLCAVNHTSGTFASDWIYNNYWIPLGDPPGSIKPWAGKFAPAGYLLLVYSSLLRSSYPNLFEASCPGLTCTITNASPAVITCAGHMMLTGECFSLETTSGLPSGLSTGTNYWAIYKSATEIWVADTYAHAVAGTKLNTSSPGDGVHTLRFSAGGIADATHFNIGGPEGAFISVAGTSAILTNANSVAFSRVRGYAQNDAFQGHKSKTYDNALGSAYSIVVGSGTSPSGGGQGYADLTLLSTGNPITDGTNGTPRTGTETNPANVAHTHIIKY